jgi:hypothetical protein
VPPSENDWIAGEDPVGFTNSIALQIRQVRAPDLTIWGATNGGTTLTTSRHYEMAKDLDREGAVGFHHRHSAIAGIRLGRAVAHWTLQRYFRPVFALSRTRTVDPLLTGDPLARHRRTLLLERANDF